VLQRPIETARLIGMWLSKPDWDWLQIMLQAQSSRELNVWQICHEIGEESSKIVPLGAPFSQ
jgi:hypothetical protein